MASERSIVAQSLPLLLNNGKCISPTVQFRY